MQPPFDLLRRAMDAFFPFLSLVSLVFAFGIAFAAGFVKGVVGFALPLVMISGLTLLLSVDLALAGLLLPTLVANIAQASRRGQGSAWDLVKNFRVFLILGALFLVSSAQLVRLVPQTLLLFAIGVPALAYATLELLGWRLHLKSRTVFFDAAFGTITGIFGGLAGIWGPPTVMYLTALGTAKDDQIRMQGVIYGVGSVALCLAHVGSGVLNADTVAFSAVLILPTLVGLWVGGRVLDRINQVMFRKATLVVLLIAGANMIRRAIVGV